MDTINLNDEKREDLAWQIIDKVMSNQRDIRLNLENIRDDKLYLEFGYSSFDDYLDSDRIICVAGLALTKDEFEEEEYIRRHKLYKNCGFRTYEDFMEKQEKFFKEDK